MDTATYLASLPPDRREALTVLVDLIRHNMPPGYTESFGFGMPVWVVPLRAYPDTYNKQPFLYVAIASQKNHMALYLTGVYGDPDVRAAFEQRWAESGKKLDMGKSCVRFKRLEDVCLEAVAETIAAVPMDALIDHARAVQGRK